MIVVFVIDTSPSMGRPLVVDGAKVGLTARNGMSKLDLAKMAVEDIVGKSVTRPDAWDKVTGGRGYPVNVQLPGMLHGKLLRSPFPHARIIRVPAPERSPRQIWE